MSKPMRVVLLLTVSMIMFAAISMAQGRPQAGGNVQRAKAPTPEVHSTEPEMIDANKQVEIVVRGKYLPTGEVKYNVGKPCELVKATPVSSTEIRLTIIGHGDQGADCSIYMYGERNAWTNLRVKPSAAVEAKREQEQLARLRAEMEKNATNPNATVRDMALKTLKALDTVGTSWSVVLPNGKTDTWTLQSGSMMGGQFKSSAGEPINIMLQGNNELMAMVGSGCMWNGKINGNSVTGSTQTPASVCKLGSGKWKATISK